MKNLLSLCSIFSTVAVVHASPPINARARIPKPGEICEYHWPGHDRRYTGKVTETDNCKDGVSFWQYGNNVNVQCCVREPCTAFSETDGGEYGQYFCLNTYKTDDCGGGSGKFVAGHCLGDATVQCCQGQLTYTSSTNYNSLEVYPNGEQSIPNTGIYDPDTKGIIVPTQEASGPSSSEIGNGRDQAKVSNMREVSMSTHTSSEERMPSTYGRQRDGTWVVPTVKKTDEIPRQDLSWRIIPKGST